jgi:hypothetical protein
MGEILNIVLKQTNSNGVRVTTYMVYNILWRQSKHNKSYFMDFKSMYRLIASFNWLITIRHRLHVRIKANRMITNPISHA